MGLVNEISFKGKKTRLNILLYILLNGNKYFENDNKAKSVN